MKALIQISGAQYACGENNVQAVMTEMKEQAEGDSQITKGGINLEIVKGHGLTTSSGHADPFYGAPVVLVVLALKECATRVYDGSLVMENMMVAAHSLGLGSCWIHRAKETFETEEGREILRSLGITDEYEGIGNCIVGWAADDALRPQSPRKPDYVKWV